MNSEVIATTNDIRNKRRREAYAARKDEINEQRRKRKADKKIAKPDAFDFRLDRSRRTSFMEGTSYGGSSNQTIADHVVLPLEISDGPLNAHARDLDSAFHDPQDTDSYTFDNPKRFAIISLIPNEPFVLPKGSVCRHCNAKKFWKETENFCCKGGQVELSSNAMPNELRELFLTKTIPAIEFRKISRSYNNHFAFTSLGVNYDKDLCRMSKGIYTFRVQGQVHHFVNTLLPKEHNPSYFQLYFYDTDHELDNRTNMSPKFDPNIMKSLIEVLKVNPYSQFFRSLSQLESLDSVSIILRANPTVDQRVFNKPSTSQVAALWVEDESSDGVTNRDICVRSHSNQTHRVKYFYGCYDPLQYPLLFPFGELGWHEGIKRLPKTTRATKQAICNPIFHTNASVDELLTQEETVLQTNHLRAQVSLMEYYCYKLQIRNCGTSIILHTGRLLQQYVVDMYVKIETARLDFYRKNQKQIRAELYQGIVDCVNEGETLGRNVGKRIVLPASFLGGPRDNSRRYMDAMALVQRFGKPDLFLTMTCNPNWPEIKDELLYNDEAQNRPDLVSRIFKAKLEELKIDLFKKHIFGIVVAYIYVVEFQKRGLPHAHFLIILGHNSKVTCPKTIDAIVSCQIPSETEQAYLRSRVVKHMMHGPCGPLNPKNVCMENTSKCKNKYPKEFISLTTVGKNSYATYKRPNDGETLKIRGHYLDNRWVVPYNPYLLAKFDCHINVEICSSVDVVKYMYKYLYKGHDRIAFTLGANQHEDIIDEISKFQNARWISAPEAMWRIYGFHLFEHDPSVIRLPLHLPNKQTVTFNDHDNLTHVANNDFLQRTMLTEYFRMNTTDLKAKTILYKDFPKYYVWNREIRRWEPRKQGSVIGRIVSVAPNDTERFYLRLLLNHIKGPTWFDDYYKVDCVIVHSFHQAASLHGLLNEDKNCSLCMAEAVIYQMPHCLRRLFATILLFCAPNDPLNLWITYKDFMIEDYVKQGMSTNVAEQTALKCINNILELSGKDINDYNLVTYNVCLNEQEKLASMIAEETANHSLDENEEFIREKLNNDQRNAYDTILENAINNNGGIFFIDGPGGTGKTFLYKNILTSLRKRGFVALATASSGVAASLLPGGRTAHSRFKIPLDLFEESTCSVTKQSALGKLIIMSKLIIWDEAPMVHRFAIEALHKLLQDLMLNQLPFGGKVVVFGGDFRQILPVIPQGNQQDIVQSSLIFSRLWPSFTRMSLTQNMRAHDDPNFSKYLLLIGSGDVPLHSCDMIKLMPDMIVPYETDEKTSLKRLIEHVFPNNISYQSNALGMVSRVILTPKNENVDIINNMLLDNLEGEKKTYYSFDERIDTTDHDIHEDFLNTLTPNGMPPHELVLKKNCPILLLRNINPSEGLCNGTRLICKDFNRNVINAEIATGEYSGKPVLLPRIPFIPLESEKGSVPFKRTQFPIRPCFAMTINKAQGQTLDFIGLYLPEPVFSHGQLYVALSRARTSANIKILIKPLNKKHEKNHPSCTKNVVYREVLDALQATLS